MRPNLRAVSIAVAVALGMLGAVQIADPESLGISAISARWLGILATGLGILSSFLPRVQGPTTDPETLADRVWSLPDEDRRLISIDLAQRAEREARADEIRMPEPAPRRRPRPPLEDVS